MEILALIFIGVGFLGGMVMGMLFVIKDNIFVWETIKQAKDYIEAKKAEQDSGITNDRDAKIWKSAYITGCNDILDFFRYGDKG